MSPRVMVAVLEHVHRFGFRYLEGQATHQPRNTRFRRCMRSSYVRWMIQHGHAGPNVRGWLWS